MLRNVLCAVVLLGVSLSVTLAETVKGTIKKIDGTTITVEVGKKNEKQTKEFKIGDGCKVCQKAGKEKKELAGGVGALKIGKGGIPAALEVNDGVVSEIVIAGGGDKKKKKDAK